MKCRECKEKNIVASNYCKKCGYHFTNKEQTIAKKKTLVGILESIENIYKVLNLEIITGNILFKIVSILVVLLIGVYLSLNNGNTTKILNSDNYKIQYNQKENEYYLIVNEEETNLNMYVPKNVDNLEIKHLDKNNELIESVSYKEVSNISLLINGLDDYYLFDSYKNDKLLSSIKVYVYRGDDNE